MNILVLCTGNSARSILLEHILRHRSNGRVTSFSAGSRPTGAVHPQALGLLAARGMDTTDARSKSWDEFAADTAPTMDAVITVCSAAAGEECPLWPGAPIRAHWGVEDPAAAPEPAQAEAFEAAYAILDRRAAQFLAAVGDATNLETRAEALQSAGRVP